MGRDIAVMDLTQYSNKITKLLHEKKKLTNYTCQMKKLIMKEDKFWSFIKWLSSYNSYTL